MEDDSILRKLEMLLLEAESARVFTDTNFKILDSIMRQYWLIVKELNEAIPNIFNNIATNGIIDLINRSNLTESTEDTNDKKNHYKDYWDYLTHSISLTINYIKNYLPESSHSNM